VFRRAHEGAALPLRTGPGGGRHRPYACAALAGGAEASPREVAHLDGFLIAPSLIGREVAWMDQECSDCLLEGTTRFRVFTSGLSSTKAPLRLAQGYNETTEPTSPRRRIAARRAATGFLRIRVKDRTGTHELTGSEQDLTLIERRVRLVGTGRTAGRGGQPTPR